MLTGTFYSNQMFVPPLHLATFKSSRVSSIGLVCGVCQLLCFRQAGSASSTTPHGVVAGGARSAVGVPQDQQQTASGAFDGGASGPGLTSRDAILRVIRRNLDSRRMPPQSTKDGKWTLSRKAAVATVAWRGELVAAGGATVGLGVTREVCMN